MAKKCARTFSIVVEKGKKSILDVTHLLPDALPRSVHHIDIKPRRDDGNLDCAHSRQAGTEPHML